MDEHAQGGQDGEAGRERALSERVLRLEESLGFAAYEADQLGAHVRALMGAIDALAKRVERLEARLARMSEPDEPPAGTA